MTFAFVILFLTLDIVVVLELDSPGGEGLGSFQSSLILVCIDYFEGKNTPLLGSPQVIVFCQVSFCVVSVLVVQIFGVCTDFIMF